MDPPTEVLVRSKNSSEWRAIPWDEYERRIREMVETFREASERSVQSGDRFSRECVPCRNTNPKARSVAVECGHLVCCDCAATAKMCPLCMTSTSFLRIYEESTRDCTICCEVPLYRTFFNPCGHVVCAACIIELRTMSVRNNAFFRCPYCQTRAQPGGFHHLREELIGEEIRRREQDEIEERKRTRHRLRHEVEIKPGKELLWPAQQLERKNQTKSDNKNMHRPNRCMVRVNQPMKQHQYGRR